MIFNSAVELSKKRDEVNFSSLINSEGCWFIYMYQVWLCHKKYHKKCSSIWSRTKTRGPRAWTVSCVTQPPDRPVRESHDCILSFNLDSNPWSYTTLSLTLTPNCIICCLQTSIHYGGGGGSWIIYLYPSFREENCKLLVKIDLQANLL